VRGIQRIRDLNGNVENGLGIQRTPRDTVLEGLAVEELHRDEWLTLGLPDLINRTDVGVV
jgi:hypothetical protein